MAGTILRLGWSDPRTDVFGAHPLLGDVVDLNDGVTFTLLDGALELAPPTREVALAGNARTQGERATRALYRHNREARAQLILGPMASYSDLIANVRTLVRWLDAAPATPFCVQRQPPSATAPVYLDVVGAAHALPADERDWLRLQVEPIEIVLLVRPGLRGDRITLSNLVVNPGFEAPSGPGVGVFNDTFANANAYSVQAGAALTQDTTRFPDTLKATAAAAGGTLLRSYRLDEASGALAIDASPTLINGAYVGGPTLGVAGSLTGESDTAVTLNGTTQYVTIPTAGLPTGNGAWTLGGRFKTTTATIQMIWQLGGSTSKTAALLYLDASGHAVGDLFSSSITSAGTYKDGAWHTAVLAWDGTTLTLYVDNAQVATSSTVGPDNISYPANGCTLGAQWTSSYINLFNGSLDECFIIGGAALSLAQAQALHSAATTAPALAANTLAIPAGGRVKFGSPAWAALNQWQLRWRYNGGATATCYLHYTDASNHLALSYTASTTTLALVHTVAGVAHTLAANAGIILVNGVWYWLQITQFPSAPTTQCDVQATLLADNAGAPGTTITTLGPVATFDGVTALSGAPQLAASGSAVGLGGAFPNVHTLSLFGPGGWSFNGGNGAPTGLSAGSWEQATANTYPGGAVTSFGAARMDLPPAGTVGAAWESYSGGAPLGTSAIPTATGQIMAASVSVRSTGLSVTAALALSLREWDASGNLLRTTTLQSLSGNQSAWVKLSGSVTIGATTAFCSVLLSVSDATAGASAGGSVWWDNTQCWNVTTTGISAGAMPYCELRFPQSPAQLLLTGLLGDLPAPAFLAWGTYLASWGLGATLSYAIGRRGQAGGSAANARLVAASIGFFGAALSPTATAVLDSSSYGGYYVTAPLNPSWNPRAFSFAPGDALGVYHLFSRAYSSQSLGNLPNVQTRAVTQQKSGAWYGDLTSLDQLGATYGPLVAPLAASATWTPADSGQVNVPALPAGALTDLSQTYLTPRAQWGDNTGGGSTLRVNWQALLPVDGSLLVGILNNAANAPFAVTTRWLWAYHDGLPLNLGAPAAVGDSAAATYSLESIPTANPAHGGGGPGTQGTGVINLNSGADPALILDPTQSVAAVAGAVGSAAGGSGVNQLAAYVADNAGSVLPFHAEVSYSPLYLYPR